MSDAWKSTTLTTEEKALHVLADLSGKRWLCRGESQHFKELLPTIDRDKGQNLSRLMKLRRERTSINVFRSTARFFADQGERGALGDDFIALMVLRHYGVPTRLVDWSWSPYVAAYFAVCCDDEKDGRIWSFDEPRYEQVGKQQWRKWPETTKDGSGEPEKFDANLTAFALKNPPDWFICGFYPQGFPRQGAQQSVYTVTARFGRDHAEKIANLLAEDIHYHLYAVSARLKPRLRRILHEEHGIWRGSLFPDSAGAAETTVRTAFPNWDRRVRS